MHIILSWKKNVTIFVLDKYIHPISIMPLSIRMRTISCINHYDRQKLPSKLNLRRTPSDVEEKTLVKKIFVNLAKSLAAN
jgi:hypothetical protein